MKRQSLRKNIEFLLEQYVKEVNLINKELEKENLDLEEREELEIRLEDFNNIIEELEFALEISEV